MPGFRHSPNEACDEMICCPACGSLGLNNAFPIAFHVTSGLVTLDRIFYGGRDLDVLVNPPDIP